jgi:hypothetical protein
MPIRSEQIIVFGEDSTPKTITVVVDDVGGLAIDYTFQFEKIAFGLENLVEQTTRIAESSEEILALIEKFEKYQEKIGYQLEKSNSISSIEFSFFNGSVVDDILTIDEIVESSGISIYSELIHQDIKLRTLIIEQVTYLNDPIVTVESPTPRENTDKIIVPSTENIFVGQIVEGFGIEKEDKNIEGSTTVIKIENDVVTLSLPIVYTETVLQKVEYKFFNKNKEGTYRLSQTQDQEIELSLFEAIKGSTLRNKPYDWVDLVSIYKLLVEENSLGAGPIAISGDAFTQIKRTMLSYIDKIKDLPTLK